MTKNQFMWMYMPKKPSEDGQLTRALWNCMTLHDLNIEVKAFMAQHPHLGVRDISIEFDPHDYEINLEAAGKSHKQYEKEMKAYKKEMKAYRIWQATNADEIIAFKEAEKKRIAKAKLERTTTRLKKELAVIEAKQAALEKDLRG